MLDVLPPCCDNCLCCVCAGIWPKRCSTMTMSLSLHKLHLLVHDAFLMSCLLAVTFVSVAYVQAVVQAGRNAAAQCTHSMSAMSQPAQDLCTVCALSVNTSQMDNDLSVCAAVCSLCLIHNLPLNGCECINGLSVGAAVRRSHLCQSAQDQ